MKIIKPITILLALSALTVAVAQTGAGTELALPGMGKLEFSGDSTILPLTGTSGHPQVMVDLGDGQEYTFIVDTGASVNVLDYTLAERLGYEITGETEIGAPGGPQVPGNIVRVPVARVGEASIRDAEFVTMDVNGFSMGLTQGVLSSRLFHDYLLTCDLAKGQIRVAHESLTADEPDVISYTDLGGGIQIDMDVAGLKVASHIDTGSIGTFTLPAEYQQSLPLKSAPMPGPTARLVGGERKSTVAQLDGIIRFAGMEYMDPHLVFMDPSPGYGNIGMGVMGQLLVSLDQKNQLVRFRRSSGKDVVIDANAGARHFAAANVGTAANPNGVNGKRRQLGVMLRGIGGGTSGLEIAGVVPGSLAESAGFREGDRLITVNGRPGGELTTRELGELFGSLEPLTFGIERGGVAKTIEIE